MSKTNTFKRTTKCAICGYEAPSSRALRYHVKKHVEKGEFPSLEEYWRLYIDECQTENPGYCKFCGKPVPFVDIFRGYLTYCGHACSVADPDTKSLAKQNQKKSLKEKYGVEYVSQIKEVAEKAKQTKIKRYGTANNLAKMKQTNLERYGVENPTQVEEIKAKIKITNLERYGTACPANNEEIVEEIKARNRELYGVEWAQQRPEIKAKSIRTSVERYGGVLMGSPVLSEKIRKTWEEKYGVDHPNRDPEQRQKAVETNLKRYGVQNLLSLPESREKAKQTMVERYGREYAMQVPELQEKQKEHDKSAYGLRWYIFKSGKKLSYLSNMERAFLEDCEENGMEVEKGDDVEYVFDGKSHVFHVDFRIRKNDNWQLVEIKGTNSFYWKALESGLQDAKNKGAEEYSQIRGYLPYLYLLNYSKGEISRWM